MKSLILAILATLLIGCSSSEQTIVRIDTLRYVLPGRQDTLTIVKTDTIWSASNPRYVVRIDTVKQRVFIYAKAETLKIAYIDTVKQTIEKIIETPFLSKLGIGAIGFALCLGVLFVLRLKSII